MKKKMRITAALAGAVVLGIPAVPANALWYWGAEGMEKFADMTPVDDKGMFGSGEHYVYVSQNNALYNVRPRQNTLRFCIRPELDEAEAGEKIAEIVRKYYPDIWVIYENPSTEMASVQEKPQLYKYDIGVSGSYEIFDLLETSGSEEIANGLMHDLAAEDLITAFYTWGQTAWYEQQQYYTNINVYFSAPKYRNNNDKTYETVTYDWDAIGAWAAEHHPEYEFVRFTTEDTEIADLLDMRYYYSETDEYHDKFGQLGYREDDPENNIFYAFIPPEDTPFAEQFAFSAELYEQFGLRYPYIVLESASSGAVGQNALATPGDLNIDGAVNVSDAVLLARLAGNDAELQLIPAGMNNADITGDGMFTADDLDKLLDMIVGA